MEPQFGRVTIIGVGLLGASLGLALKARGLADHIIGVGRRKSSLDTARSVGAVDETSLEAGRAVEGADLVILTTPAAQVIAKMDEILAYCPVGAVVTDVASTKYLICGHAEATWPHPRRFVGSHPMAGSEKFGPEHGRPDFFERSVCLVESGAGLDPQAREKVVRLWRAIGADVVDIEPVLHDALLARTSHVPHVVAAAIATLAVRRGDVRQLIGNGFRDVTRIAGSRPEVWRDICATNRAAILEGLEELRSHLAQFCRALSSDDTDAIEQYFNEGRTARREVVDE